jgi:hypothetical protein
MRLFEFIDPVPCFYHGSTTPGLKTLQRNPSKLAADKIVFAATMPEIAIAMSGHWTDDEFSFGHQTDTKRQDIEFPPFIMREKQPGNFDKYFRHPIYLYEVPAEYFEADEALQDFEVMSRTDVPVHTWIKFDDPLAYLTASPVIRLVFAK